MNEIMVSPALVQIQDRMWMSVSMIFLLPALHLKDFSDIMNMVFILSFSGFDEGKKLLVVSGFFYFSFFCFSSSSLMKR